MNSPLCGRLDLNRIDKRLRCLLEKNRELEMLRFEASRKIYKLQKALSLVSGRLPEDLVHVPGGLDYPREPDPDGPVAEANARILRCWHRASELARELSPEASQALEQRLLDLCMFRRSVVESYVQGLQLRVQGLDDACQRLIEVITRIRKEEQPEQAA